MNQNTAVKDQCSTRVEDELLACQKVFLTGPWLVILALFLSVVLLGVMAFAVRAGSINPPVLIPSPNSHSAPVTTTINISLTTSIDPSTITSRTITIMSEQQGLVTGTYLVANAQIIITPAYPFFPGELVHTVITTGTHSITDTALTSPFVWQFRTAVQKSEGKFISHSSGLDSTWSEDISLGDLDRDGDLDIFLAHRDEASSVWFNDGSGGFTTDGINLGNPFLIDGSLIDVDRDGDLDAILAGIQDNQLWKNDGYGSFHFAGNLFGEAYTIMEVSYGDVDGDGDLDAVTAMVCDFMDPNQLCNYAVNRIWLNDGNGSFLPSTQSLGHGTTLDISLGDLDNDLDLDGFVVSTAQEGTVWTNTGGIFTRTQVLSNLFAGSVSLGDVDGDGDLDAFVSPQGTGTEAVWRNNGSGVFEPKQFLGAVGPSVLNDLDGDGDLDAFSISEGASKVWLNQGNGTFIFSGQTLSSASTTGVELGDLDSDGDLDAVTSGYYANPRMWVNHIITNTLPSLWIPLLIRSE